MESIIQSMNFNMVHIFRTGKPMVDLCVSILLPLLISSVVAVFSSYLIPLCTVKVDQLLTTRLRRCIVYSYEAMAWQDVQTSAQNGVLHNAIRMYIGRALSTPYHAGTIKLSRIESGTAPHKRTTVVEQLEKEFMRIHLPQRETFEEIEPGLFFKECMSKIDPNEDDEDRKKKKQKSKTVVSMVFEVDRAAGEAKINEFIRRAYDWYVDQVEKNEDKSRFMYQPLVLSKFLTVDQRRKPRLYKRYELSGEKTFNSLFFPEKSRLLKILDHFANKTGKYSIKGFPYKLGLLLHGPPGTGKTSLVKAIAAYTSRSIVSVPLSRIYSNQELMDVMFDQKFNYKIPKKAADDEGGDDDSGQANHLAFKDVIFLLEDVDAASSVVHARTTRKSTMAKRVTNAIERQLTAMGEESVLTAETPTNSTALDTTTSAAAKLAEQQKLILDVIKLQSQMGSGSGNGAAEQASGMAAGGEQKKKSDMVFVTDKDKLSLSGLLTVLDGVIDAPGRILIMTTNHPEKLDPALTRPGRVNMQIYMGFIKVDAAKEMVRHYYGREQATEEALQLVVDAFASQTEGTSKGFRMSPAEMEQFCAECDTIPQLAERIRKKGKVD